jgi:transcriptional regulator with XRE-family HTH domain
MVGARIAGKRVERRLKQVELAERAGVSQSLIAQLELGHRPGMTFEAVAKIATALECSLDWLAWGDAGRPSPTVLLEERPASEDELAVC